MRDVSQFLEEKTDTAQQQQLNSPPIQDDDYADVFLSEDLPEEKKAEDHLLKSIPDEFISFLQQKFKDVQVANNFRERLNSAIHKIRKELYTIDKLALYSSPIDYDGRINLAWF